MSAEPTNGHAAQPTPLAGDKKLFKAGPEAVAAHRLEAPAATWSEHEAPIRNNTCGCGKLAAQERVGPFLRYTGLRADNPGIWTGSCLLVLKASESCKPSATTMKLTHIGHDVLLKDPKLIIQYKDWHAIRFDLEFPMQTNSTQIDYHVSAVDKEFNFFIPGTQEPVRWGFYSCSGFSSDVAEDIRVDKFKGLDPLWLDVLDQHKIRPMHLMVGGGDQLYCDDVWQVPALESWLKIESKEERIKVEFSQAMQEEVDAYYFHHYATHFSYGPIGYAMATIPQTMTWDDHDIFDGWGSYPKALQVSPVFQGVFAAAKRWYSTFQQHSQPQDVPKVKMLVLGPRVAFCMPDQRQYRTQREILPLDTYMKIIMEIQQLPDTVRHVVLVATVPIVYPHLTGSQTAMNCIGTVFNKTGAIGSALKKTGASATLLGQFGEPELMDDLKDHWNNPEHLVERRFFIEHLQMVAKARSIRISIISGDVHLCASGRLYSWPKVNPGRFLEDFRYMEQITSSAICNPPPPDALAKLLNFFGKAGLTNKYTRHKMNRLFTDQAISHKLVNKRNWCEVEERLTDNHIIFHIRVEDAVGGAMKPYSVDVPPLKVLPGDDLYDFQQRQSCC